MHYSHSPLPSALCPWGFWVTYSVVAFPGIYWVWAWIPVVDSTKKTENPSLDLTATCFCVHIYNQTNSLCIYSTYTVQKNTTWLLFIVHCFFFCERVAFIFDITVFLAHRLYLEKQWRQQWLRESFDGPTNWNRSRSRTGVLVPPTDKHNFVSFSAITSFYLPVTCFSWHVFLLMAVTCKIIPQN